MKNEFIGVVAAYVRHETWFRWIRGSALLSLLVAAVTLVVPAIRLLDSTSWSSETCEVIEARLLGGSAKWTEVTYSYNVGQEEYVSTRIDFGPRLASAFGDEAEEEFAALGGGQAKTVRCFIDPSQPDNSVIFREVHWARGVSIPILLFVFVGLGPLIAAFALRRKVASGV